VGHDRGDRAGAGRHRPRAPLARRPDGLLICTFWLAECLALGGELERAEAWFARAAGCANDLGLMAEEADPDRRELLGNFPQAFSHVGLINAAWRLTEAAAPPPKETP
jgi:GH15 family glucan-1,4-alpha-glucosidase